jgi:hypothetical protein
VGSNPTVYWMDISVATYKIERKIIKEGKKKINKKIHKTVEEAIDA